MRCIGGVPVTCPSGNCGTTAASPGSHILQLGTLTDGSTGTCALSGSYAIGAYTNCPTWTTPGTYPASLAFALSVAGVSLRLKWGPAAALQPAELRPYVLCGTAGLRHAAGQEGGLAPGVQQHQDHSKQASAGDACSCLAGAPAAAPRLPHHAAACCAPLCPCRTAPSTSFPSVTLPQPAQSRWQPPSLTTRCAPTTPPPPRSSPPCPSTWPAGELCARHALHLLLLLLLLLPCGYRAAPASAR